MHMLTLIHRRTSIRPFYFYQESILCTLAAGVSMDCIARWPGVKSCFFLPHIRHSYSLHFSFLISNISCSDQI